MAEKITKENALKIIKLMRRDWDTNSKCANAHALDMAAEALEKQIPKEPYQYYFHCECPTCHMSYGMATQKVKYCYNCGQAIKWE